MTVEVQVLYEIRDLLYTNTIATWAGALIALVALVIALIAFFKNGKNT